MENKIIFLFYFEIDYACKLLFICDIITSIIYHFYWNIKKKMFSFHDSDFYTTN